MKVKCIGLPITTVKRCLHFVKLAFFLCQIVYFQKYLHINDIEGNVLCVDVILTNKDVMNTNILML